MGNLPSKFRQTKRRRVSEEQKYGLYDTNACAYSIPDAHSLYIIAGGRKFYKRDAKYNYCLPVDELEAARTIDQHACIKELFQGNFSAPIHNRLKSGCKVLDIGSGPGAWILDMAQDFPSSSFIGVDIVPLFPTNSALVPKNVEFLQVNILDGLSIEDNSIDVISVQMMTGCFTPRQWESTVMKELERVLKPGGWIDWTEADYTMKNRGEAGKKMVDAMLSLINSSGSNPVLFSEVQKMLESSGKWNKITETKKALPLGKNGGENGERFLKTFANSWVAAKKPLMEFTSQTPQEFDRLIGDFYKEVDMYNTAVEFHRVCAQKT